MKWVLLITIVSTGFRGGDIIKTLTNIDTS